MNSRRENGTFNFPSKSLSSRTYCLGRARQARCHFAAQANNGVEVLLKSVRGVVVCWNCDPELGWFL
jgi:hypothetical protein